MATLWIAELAHAAWSPHTGFLPAGMSPPVAEQTVSYTTAAQSSAFNGSARFVRVISDGICHLAFGTDPTATTSSALRMVAGSAEYFGVVPGMKLSVVQGT